MVAGVFCCVMRGLELEAEGEDDGVVGFAYNDLFTFFFVYFYTSREWI